MTIFNISYCASGTRVIDYDYYYNHVFFGYSKREIEKRCVIRWALNTKWV